MTCYNLAFAVTQYFDYGGMQRTLLRIAETCVKRGHQVELFTDKWESKRPKPFTVHELNIKTVSNHDRNDQLADHIHQLRKTSQYDCITGFTKIKGLDIYYAGDPCFAARFKASKPGFFKILPRYKALLRQEAEVFRPGINTEILLIAHQEKEKFVAHYGTESHRFHLLPPGINREFLSKQKPNDDEIQAVRRDTGVVDDHFLILSVGSGFRTKGVDRSIKALAALPDGLRQRCRLIVVGKGKPKPYLLQAKKLGVQEQIEFIGVCDEVARFYYSADLLLHPAISENTGTTIIEAMYCGLPVLTTENCGFSSHLQKANAGLICPVPFAQENLNRQLEEALTSNQRLRWKENGRDYCETTDLYSLIDRAADIIIAGAEKNKVENH